MEIVYISAKNAAFVQNMRLKCNIGIINDAIGVQIAVMLLNGLRKLKGFVRIKIIFQICDIVFINFKIEIHISDQIIFIPYIHCVECFSKKEKGMDWLKRFGMEHLAKKKPFQMSGGECQRIAIIRALVKDPDIIFADEPTASLDRQNAVMIYELLREVSAGKILVTATHDLSLFHGDERILKIENCKVTT